LTHGTITPMSKLSVTPTCANVATVFVSRSTFSAVDDTRGSAGELTFFASCSSLSLRLKPPSESYEL